MLKKTIKLDRLDYFEAIEKSLGNAKELIEEAEILAEKNKVARAYTLFQFSIEEVGKAFLTFNFVLKGDIESDVETKKFYKNFINHLAKTEFSQGIDFMFAIMADKSDLTKKLLENSFFELGKVHISNDYKNYSLYTSLIDNKFHKPSEIITKEKLDKIAYYAKLRLQVAEPFLNLGIQNFDVLYETRNNLDEETTSIEGYKKIKEILKN
ncbi:AbiV family abortive infection protein [Flavobacterium sp.]|uniref:AbiV family abortive infection protein n=1 Tax=Flavobacterium sp. TaxID=239 RepID=UPI003751D83B